MWNLESPGRQTKSYELPERSLRTKGWARIIRPNPFPTPSHSRLYRLHQPVDPPVKSADSGRQTVRQSPTRSRRHGVHQSAPDRHRPRVPTKRELVGLFRQVLPTEVMPRADHAALEQAEKALVVLRFVD